MNNQQDQDKPSDSTYENGFWFVHDGVLHRCRPEIGFLFVLNTIESQWALHSGPNRNGIFHSARVVTNEEEVIEHGGSMERRCEICFPETGA